MEKDASGKVGCHTRTGNKPLCQSCTLLLLLCLSHLYHTGFGIIRMLSRGLICPWCEGTEEERLAAARAGTLFSQDLPWDLCSSVFPHLISVLQPISPGLSLEFPSPLPSLHGNKGVCKGRGKPARLPQFTVSVNSSGGAGNTEWVQF